MARSTKESRTVIMMLCDHLQHLKERTPEITGAAEPFSNDSYLLLEEATEKFCRSVSEIYGEDPTRRWNDLLPEFLLRHPERCDEVLGLIERKQFEPLPYFALAGSSR